MRKLVFLFTLLTTITIGCEKADVYHRLQGSWRIIGISGTYFGFESIRDFDKIYFNNSDKYYVSFDGSEIQGGSYEIEKLDNDKYSRSEVEFRLILHESFNNHPYANFYSYVPFDIMFNGNDTLTLSQADIFDGYNYHFVRK